MRGAVRGRPGNRRDAVIAVIVTFCHAVPCGSEACRTVTVTTLLQRYGDYNH